MFNWAMDFLNRRSIEVIIGSVISRNWVVENGTPQGSVISPILLNIMINYITFGQELGDHCLQMMVFYGKEPKI